MSRCPLAAAQTSGGAWKSSLMYKNKKWEKIELYLLRPKKGEKAKLSSRNNFTWWGPGALGSAPASRSRFTIEEWPQKAAVTRGRQPSLLKRKELSWIKFKHRKNCECCPGHYQIVSHYSSMSWFKFSNLSVIVNRVTETLIHCQSQSKCKGKGKQNVF